MNTEKIVNQILVDNRMTQVELAEKIGVSRVHLCDVINGNRTSNPVKRKLAIFFKKNETELFPSTKKNGPQAARVSRGIGSLSRKKSAARSHT